MGKYARDLDEALEKKVKDLSIEMGLKANGISVEAIRLKKSKTTVGEVVKGNDLVKLFTGDDNFIAVALYEDAFNLVDEQTQTFWIESLLNQISYDSEKDQIVITKPELAISTGMYHKYKNVAVEKTELALLTIKQIDDMKKQAKEDEKARKAEKKKQKFG